MVILICNEYFHFFGFYSKIHGQRFWLQGLESWIPVESVAIRKFDKKLLQRVAGIT